VKKIRYEVKQPQAAGEDDQLILRTEFGEDVLLVLLEVEVVSA
jgi:hypothetical protein